MSPKTFVIVSAYLNDYLDVFDVICDVRDSSWGSALSTLDVSLCALWRTVVAVSGY